MNNETSDKRQQIIYKIYKLSLLDKNLLQNLETFIDSLKE